MSKKFIFICLMLLVSLFTLTSLTACELSDIPVIGDLLPGNSDDGQDDTDKEPSDDEGNGENTDGEKEPEIEITLEVLEAAVFVDKEFDYDGEEHSIYVTNVPDVVNVTYRNNGKVNPGKFLVQATLEYGELKVVKKANIIINRLKGEITAENKISLSNTAKFAGKMKSGSA